MTSDTTSPTRVGPDQFAALTDELRELHRSDNLTQDAATKVVTAWSKEHMPPWLPFSAHVRLLTDTSTGHISIRCSLSLVPMCVDMQMAESTR